jgi:hypothetical protein
VSLNESPPTASLNLGRLYRATFQHEDGNIQIASLFHRYSDSRCCSATVHRRNRPDNSLQRNRVHVLVKSPVCIACDSSFHRNDTSSRYRVIRIGNRKFALVARSWSQGNRIRQSSLAVQSDWSIGHCQNFTSEEGIRLVSPFGLPSTNNLIRRLTSRALHLGFERSLYLRLHRNRLVKLQGLANLTSQWECHGHSRKSIPGGF